MTNKIQLITAIAIATILVTSGFSLTPEAFSTGSSGSDKDKKWDDKKDKEGGFDFSKFKTWKNNHDDDDDDNKIKICHVPPGNTGNAHTIEISKSAKNTHLAHGDTLGACPNDDDDEDDEEDPATITFLRAITNDNGKAIIDMDFTISIDGTPIQTGTPIEVTPNTEHFISGTVQEGFSFVLIAGESECPSTLAADSFKIKEGKSVICTIYYDDDFVPIEAGGDGIIFHRNTIEFMYNAPGDDVSGIGVTQLDNSPFNCSMGPCVTLGGGTEVFIVDDPKINKDTSIVVMNVFPLDVDGNEDAETDRCVVKTLLPGPIEDTLSFSFQCELIEGQFDGSLGKYRINYAVIDALVVDP